MTGCPSDDSNNLPISQSCPGNWPLIELQQGVDRYITVTLVDAGGNPLDLDLDVGPGLSPEENAMPVAAEAPPAALKIFTDATGFDTARIWMKTSLSSPLVVEVLGSYCGDGMFRFHFTSENTTAGGLFVGDVQLVDGSGKVRYVKSIYIEITPTTLSDSCAPSPLSIAEVRLSLRDCDASNLLLEDFEFSDREIAICIQKVVDHWNEIPPPCFPYNAHNFPFRKHWLDGVVALLLRNISHYYRRNKHKYSAAGVSMNVMDKSEEYWAVGTQMWNEYKEWAQSKKVSMNVSSCWGRVSGGWSY